MKFSKFTIALIIVFITGQILAENAPSETEEPVKILLIGDSTTQGGKPVFENSIELLIAGEANTPLVDAINVGQGGETAYSLIESGRYENQIKGITGVDYIFFRYGINDWIHRQPFKENFPADMKRAIAQLREDFPTAKIILMTIIPFLAEQDTQVVNDYISRIAKEENLELLDLYSPYRKKMDELGRNSLTMRFFPLSGIPSNYHSLVAPFTNYYAWKKAEWLMVQTNELDPLFGHLPGWYEDSHPNTTGYRLIAEETVRFLLPKLRLSNN